LRLSNTDPVFKTLHGKYSTRSELLHANCFYDGNCEPETEMTALIRATDAYIRDAQSLAGTP